MKYESSVMVMVMAMAMAMESDMEQLEAAATEDVEDGYGYGESIQCRNQMNRLQRKRNLAIDYISMQKDAEEEILLIDVIQ